MKDDIVDYPEPFSVMPLLTLLPAGGDINALSRFTSSLYARSEKVAILLDNVDPADANTSCKHLLAEQEMLNEVLNYLTFSAAEVEG